MKQQIIQYGEEAIHEDIITVKYDYENDLDDDEEMDGELEI